MAFSDAQIRTARFCTHCGAPRVAGSFCVACGAAQPPVPAGPGEPPPPLVLVIILATGYALLSAIGVTAVYGIEFGWPNLVRLGVVGLLSYFLYRGSQSAYLLSLTYFGLGAVLTVTSGAATASAENGLLVILGVAIPLVCCGTLGTVAVRRFFFA